jgi:hypothetical protein
VNWAFPVSTLGKFAWSAEYLGDLATVVGAHAVSGAVIGSASGASVGYAGGAGNSNSILTGVARGAAIGAALGAALGGAEYAFRDIVAPPWLSGSLHPSTDRFFKVIDILATSGALAAVEVGALSVGTGIELTQGIITRQLESEAKKGGHCSFTQRFGDGNSLKCGQGTE